MGVQMAELHNESLRSALNEFGHFTSVAILWDVHKSTVGEVRIRVTCQIFVTCTAVSNRSLKTKLRSAVSNGEPHGRSVVLATTLRVSCF